jgi:xanthine dehydrogenase accessory factor
MIATAGWHEALRRAIAGGERAVLVVVATANGSTPREPGAAMAVTASAVAGTIGGGHLEYEALRIAREALRDGAAGSPWLVRFPLAARLGQCCGGVATLAFAVVDGTAGPWLDVVAACMRASTPHAIVSAIDAGRSAAARLIVTADDVRGTLGAVELDSAAIGEARARLALPAGGVRSDTAVVPVLDVALFLHLVRPETFDVAVFGNGHVGQALVHLLAALPAQVSWIDTRETDFPMQVAGATTIVGTDAPQAEVARLPHGAYVVIATHSHPLDFEIVEAALAREDLSYIGLIGSKAKRAQFERRLLARGLAPEALLRLTCPIGQGALRSKEPGVIAVAVAAEMLALRERARARASQSDASAQRGRSRG